MALKEKRTPYEVLVRFDENGEYKGAHVGYLNQVTKDGNVIHSTTELVEVNDENFPLLDVMNKVQASAIRRVEVLDTELNNLNSEYGKAVKDIEGLRTELTRSETDLNVAKDEVKQLSSELQEAQSKLVEVNKANQELINNIKVDESNKTEEVER